MNSDSFSKQLSQFINDNPIVGQPSKLYEPINYILKLGGKRVRPMILLMANKMFREIDESSISAAMAIEVFHNFTLIHDDIMDKAPLRRGKETVHQKWDDNTAILSGDAMMIKSYTYLEKLNPEVLAKVFPLFNKTALEVCEGQQFDMNFETEQEVKLDSYIRMIELKTSVLIGAAMKIGAIIGGASDSDADNIYSFGRDLGIAFQLQDDYLDLYGDPDKFGKRVGGDVVANKKTYLTIKAFQKANPSQLAKLEKLYKSTNLTFEQEEDKIVEVRKIFDEIDVKTDLRNEIQNFYNSSLKFLENVELPSEKKEDFVKFAEKLIQRDV
jgi:geranylgeranyl diphosphate synthase, type II